VEVPVQVEVGVQGALGAVLLEALLLSAPPVAQEVAFVPRGGGGVYTFSVLVASDVVVGGGSGSGEWQQQQQQQQRQRRRQLQSAAAPAAEEAMARVLGDGSLLQALAASGLAGALGYDSAESLLTAISALPPVLLLPSATSTASGAGAELQAGGSSSSGGGGGGGGSGSVSAAVIAGGVGGLVLVGAAVLVARNAAAVRAALCRGASVKPSPLEGQ
jgi:hypothetical protein